MIREELFQMVELLRDTAKLHQPNEEILTDVKAESFIFVMDSVLSALSENKGDLISREFLQTAIHNFFNGLNHTPTEEDIQKYIEVAPSVENKGEWIPVSERLPETDNENSINKYNVLLWVKNKSHPEREPQIYLGKLSQVSGDDGSGNFWGIETKPCNWTIWGWSYFNEPEVIAWQPLPEPYKEGGE